MKDDQDQTEVLNVKTRRREPRGLRWAVNCALAGLVIGCLVVGGGFAAHVVKGGWDVGWELAGWAMGK